MRVGGRGKTKRDLMGGGAWRDVSGVLVAAATLICFGADIDLRAAVGDSRGGSERSTVNSDGGLLFLAAFMSLAEVWFVDYGQPVNVSCGRRVCSRLQ